MFAILFFNFSTDNTDTEPRARNCLFKLGGSCHKKHCWKVGNSRKTLPWILLFHQRALLQKNHSKLSGSVFSTTRWHTKILLLDKRDLRCMLCRAYVSGCVKSGLQNLHGSKESRAQGESSAIRQSRRRNPAKETLARGPVGSSWEYKRLRRRCQCSEELVVVMEDHFLFQILVFALFVLFFLFWF